MEEMSSQSQGMVPPGYYGPTAARIPEGEECDQLHCKCSLSGFKENIHILANVFFSSFFAV